MNNIKNKTMIALDLPSEYWELKPEPASLAAAVASELFALDDPTRLFLYDDNFANGTSLIGDGHADCLQDDISISGEELVVEFLNLKEEECLLDQRSPQYIDYESASFSQPLVVVPQDRTAANAFDSDFPNDGGTCLVLQQLTPPQSPPQFDGYQQQPQKQLLVKEERKVLPPFANDAAVAVNATAVAASGAYSFNNWMPVSEIARETQLVDDIVNMRAQELQLPINWKQCNDDCESQASSSLGSSSNNDDISGAGSSIADADEEWLPTSSSSSSPTHTIADEEQHSTPSGSSSSSGVAKKRTRTYGRGTEDRKIRKKEQNKNAATRYRQKKKMEMEHVLGEEQELTQVNDVLRRKLIGFKRESRYLRQLIREFYKQPKH